MEDNLLGFSETNPIRIVIADDHELIRTGLISMLSDYKLFKIVGVFSNGSDAFDAITYHSPHIAILDVDMPQIDGIALTKMIKNKYPEIIVIILSAFENFKYFDAAIAAGANGYIVKDSSSEELIDALQKAIQGEFVFSSIFSKYMHNNSVKKDIENLSISFTKREQEFIQLFLQEKTNREIAVELEISVRTVETYRFNIMKKLDVNTALAMDRILRKMYKAE
jgi:DNA-binding NarL/FixJ family response regulator